MTITTQSPIVGAGGTVAEAMAFLDVPDDQDVAYVNELFRLCGLTGISFAIACSQFLVETADATSPRWLTNRNPAGLGIAADGDPDPAKLTGKEAASVHVRALQMAAIDSNIVDYPTTPASTDAFFARWYRKITDLYYPRGVIRTVADLCRHYTDASGEQQATWAWDETYADQIAAKANLIFKDTGGPTVPDITFGNVPKPSVVDRHLPTSNPWISESPTDRAIEAVVWHRMIGTLNGTDGWFRGEHAATAYGIGVAATDGALAGTIYEWIDPESRFYGESSGPVSAPYGDGLALVNLVGINHVNARSEAIEISGNYDTPLDDAARAAIVGLTAWFADRRRIPWDAFPIVPGTTRSFVCWHQELTIGTGKVRPGQVVMDETPALIAAVAERLKQFQGGTGPIPPVPAEKPIPAVPWDRGTVGVQTINGGKALAMVGQVTAKRDVPLRDSASSKGKVLKTLKAGQTAVIIGTIRLASARWAFVQVDDSGATYRAPLSAFHEKWPVL